MLITKSLIIAMVILHWVVYMLTTVILIYLISLVSGNLNSVFNINILSVNTRIQCIYIILLSSTMGLPPFIGFWTKLYILTQIGTLGGCVAILLSVITATISIFFYLTVLRYSTADTAWNNIRVNQKQSKLLLAAALLCTIGTLFLGDIHLFIYTLFFIG